MAEALEWAMTSPTVRGSLLPAERCDHYLDRLAKLDVASYAGGKPEDSYAAILLELESLGLVSDDVWQVLRRPPGDVP